MALEIKTIFPSWDQKCVLDLAILALKLLLLCKSYKKDNKSRCIGCVYEGDRNMFSYQIVLGNYIVNVERLGPERNQAVSNLAYFKQKNVVDVENVYSGYEHFLLLDSSIFYNELHKSYSGEMCDKLENHLVNYL